MAKRVVGSDDSDRDQPYSASASKRVRTNDATPESSPVQHKGKGRAPPEEEQDDSEDETEEQRRLYDEEQRRFRDRAVEPASIAEAGVIMSIDLKDFMCHALLTVNFGPQVNFLVGHNGSGKSAVLAGITMALGGTARMTNRAGNAKGFVKDGKSFAMCTVKLSNKGDTAYEHRLYGDSITIERKLGETSGYKTKNHEGKTIRTDKAEVEAITDHFNIHVDNPLTVLTQDASRKFLTGSTDADKYEFFLKGTQLHQLTIEYETIHANITKTATILERKQLLLPDLIKAYREAKLRFKDAEASIGQRGRKDALHNELAWSYVHEVEVRIALGERNIETQSRRGPQLEEALTAYRAERAAGDEEIANYTSMLETLKDVTTRQDAERAQAKLAVEEAFKKLSQLHDQNRSMGGDIRRFEAEVADYETKIAAEKAKLSVDTDQENRFIYEQIETLNDQVMKHSTASTIARHEIENAEETLAAGSDEVRGVRAQAQQMRKAHEELKGRQLALQRSSGDPLAVYGDNISKLVRMIGTERGWAQKLYGPIGTYVALKEPDFKHVLESIFGQHLNSFIVTNHRDKELLMKMMRECRVTVPIITQAEDPSFDCSAGEPSTEFLTVRRALTYSNAFVEQVSIVSIHIEKSILVKERAEGDRIMVHRPRNVESCYTANLYQVGGIDGGGKTTSMYPWGNRPRLVRDFAAEIAEHGRRIQESQRGLDEIDARFHEVDARLTMLTSQQKENKKKQLAENQRIVKLNHEISLLTQSLRANDEPSNLDHLESAKRETEEQLASAKGQNRPLEEEMGRSKAVHEAAKLRRAEVDATAKATAKTLAKTSATLEKPMANKFQLDSSINEYEGKLTKHLEDNAKLEAELQGWRDKLVTTTEQASVICERPIVAKQKASVKIIAEIKTIEKALTERARIQGATIEEITADLKSKKAIATAANVATTELRNFNNALKHSYEIRISRWNDFRQHIAARAKMQFGAYLANRDFGGRLSFDHEKLRLKLRVTTAAAAAGEKGKGADALSGGEKSFSTICFLLTMWEAIGAPIRCLDEFDVFMDAVNRMVSMKLMVDTAKAAHRVQFILITPQAMSGKVWGPEVRVTKMDDAVTGNGVLPFQAV